jgi:hypothetical protein
MPCNTITRVSLSLKNASFEVLTKALEKLGHKVTVQGEMLYWENGSYNRQTGRLEARASRYNTTSEQKHLSQIKFGYSEQLIRKQAAKFGWGVKQVSATKFEVSKY